MRDWVPTRDAPEREKIVSEEPDQHKKNLSRKDQLTPEQMEQAIEAKKSYWPFALAAAVLITLAGVTIHPIVIGIGAVLTVVAIIGWGLEYH
ncbi:MAG: hypothetical protein NVS3B14_10560 [Ktedonobacteraceae bacterium]